MSLFNLIDTAPTYASLCHRARTSLATARELSTLGATTNGAVEARPRKRRRSRCGALQAGEDRIGRQKDRKSRPCGPFAVPRARNSREQARTAFRGPQCFRGISRLFPAVRTSNENRGERFRSAWLSRYRVVCGRFAVAQTVQTRSVRDHSALRPFARTNSEPGATPSARARRTISA
jgi:hypothetical protein